MEQTNEHNITDSSGQLPSYELPKEQVSVQSAFTETSNSQIPAPQPIRPINIQKPSENINVSPPLPPIQQDRQFVQNYPTQYYPQTRPDSRYQYHSSGVYNQPRMAVPMQYPQTAYAGVPSVSGVTSAYPPQMYVYQKSPKEIEQENIKEAANVGGKLTIAIFISMIVVAVIVSVVGFLCGIVLGTPTIEDDPYMGFTPMGFYLFEGMTSLLSIFIPSLIILNSTQKSKNMRFEDFLPFKKIEGKKLAAVVFAGMAMCMVAQMMAEILSINFRFFGFDIDDAVSMTYGTRPMDIVMNSICTALIPALVEEFAYRGVVLGILKKLDTGLAIVGSAFLFGMLHGNLAQIPFAFVVGLVLAYVRIKTDSMLPNILIHFGNNFYAVILMSVGEVASSTVNDMISYSVMVLLVVIGFICIYYLSKTDKDFFKLESRQSYLTFGEKVKSFFSAGTVIVGTILLCIETIAVIKLI